MMNGLIGLTAKQQNFRQRAMSLGMFGVKVNGLPQVVARRVEAAQPAVFDANRKLPSGQVRPLF
jgi:hypothetical protein